MSWMGPKNRALLAKRDDIQKKLDDWYRAHPGPIQDMAAYKAFLTEIGYLVPEGPVSSGCRGHSTEGRASCHRNPTHPRFLQEPQGLDNPRHF